jgi:hypothetical protein
MDGFCNERRQVAVCRVGDCSQDRKGRPSLEREAARQLALHIDHGGSGRAAQLRLGAGAPDRGGGARHPLDRHVRPGVEQALREGRRDGPVGPQASVSRDDVRAEDKITWAKPWI